MKLPIVEGVVGLDTDVQRYNRVDTFFLERTERTKARIAIMCHKINKNIISVTVTPAGEVNNGDVPLDVKDGDGGDPNVIAVIVGSGMDSTGNDFVDEKMEPGIGSISGNVSEDKNNDDVGDDNLVGVLVVLKNKNGTVVATTLTDSMGDYVFYDLPAGTYSVTETNLVDVPLDVKDTDGGDANVISVILGGGENSTGNDYVDEKCRKVMGFVKEDVDENTTGDAPVALVTVELRQVLADGTVVSYMNTTTDSDGKFEFGCVPPGKYILVEYTPDGFVDVKDSDGGNPNEIVIDVTLEDNPVHEFVDRGTPLGSISGTVSEDTNNDDTGDVNLKGVILVLRDDEGKVIATTATDSMGFFEFTKVPPGNYTVTETNLGDVPLDVKDSDGGDPNVIGVTVGVGKNSTGIDFVESMGQKLLYGIGGSHTRRFSHFDHGMCQESSHSLSQATR